MAVSYLTGGAVSIPVSGRFLAHNRLPIVGKAFLAADLHAGKVHLVDPTVVQAAVLARVNTTYTHYALRQEANRFDIEAGLLPLVPAHKKLPVPMVDDAEIIDFVRRIGVSRVLDAAVVVEAAE